MKAWIGVGLAALMIGGCSSTSSEEPSAGSSAPPAVSSSPSAAPTPPASESETYTSIDDVRDAFIAAGGECDKWEQTDIVEAAIESGECGYSGPVLSLYGTHDEAMENATTVRTLSIGDGSDAGLVVGGNWVINVNDSDLAPIYADKMGAEAVVLEGEKLPTLTHLEDAVGNCDLTESRYADIGDDGYTLTLDGAPEDRPKRGATIDDIACVLYYLEIPDSVVAKIDGTRALDGMQDAEWGGISATWTYHPDDGLDLILTSTD